MSRPERRHSVTARHISSRSHSYNEAGTVAAKLNLAKRTAKAIETITEKAFQKYKQQFDKDIQNRRFFPGCTVYVYTTPRGKTHRKLFRPYKGPYKCIGLGKNGNLLLEPMKGGKSISVHKNNCKMAPFREQFFDLLRMEEPSQTRKPGRPVPTSRHIRYSAFDNPDADAGIPIGTAPPPQVNVEEDNVHGYMDESDGPDPEYAVPPDRDPNLGYRERDRFPSDPDESSMEEGFHPSSGEEETEFEPLQHSGGARPKYPARQPASKRKLPIGYYDGRVGPPPSSEQGPRTRSQHHQSQEPRLSLTYKP